MERGLTDGNTSQVFDVPRATTPKGWKAQRLWSELSATKPAVSEKKSWKEA